MIKRILLPPCFLALASLSGCGTAFSRGSGVLFGAYPFQAVAIDGCFISKTFNAPEDFMGMMAPGPLFLFWGLVSLPVDLAVDVLLLPVDLGAWILGESKQGGRMQPAPRSSGEETVLPNKTLEPESAAAALAAQGQRRWADMLVIRINMLGSLACAAMMASCAVDQASQGPKAGVMDWTKLVGELNDAEYYRGIVTPETKPFLVAFESGLTDEEVAHVERTYGFRFPPDLRRFLQTALPTGDGFPNWRAGVDGSLRSWMDGPKDGILFDVEHNEFWMEDWGPRPDSLAHAKEVAAKFIDAAPKLIPVFLHRMLPSIPHRVGNPVFSVHQTDIIYYGFDLEDYLRHEFELPGRRPWPDSIQPIEFWSKLL